MQVLGGGEERKWEGDSRQLGETTNSFLSAKKAHPSVGPAPCLSEALQPLWLDKEPAQLRDQPALGSRLLSSPDRDSAVHYGTCSSLPNLSTASEPDNKLQSPGANGQARGGLVGGGCVNRRGLGGAGTPSWDAAAGGRGGEQFQAGVLAERSQRSPATAGMLYAWGGHNLCKTRPCRDLTAAAGSVGGSGRRGMGT